jgi:hypothetical protein
MEAKLIKKSENYYELYEVRINLTLLIGSTDSERKIDVYGKDAHKLLSLSNCQAIELGYDLDELARENNKHHKRLGTVIDKLPLLTAALRQGYTEGYKEGFQKALEILGDKKFSEDDAKRLFELGIEYGHQKGYVGLDYTNDTLQSLQQTEWDVEIVGSGTVYKTVLDCCPNYHPKFGCSKKDDCSCKNNEIPKLDADGCLILKRK